MTDLVPLPASAGALRRARLHALNGGGEVTDARAVLRVALTGASVNTRRDCTAGRPGATRLLAHASAWAAKPRGAHAPPAHSRAPTFRLKTLTRPGGPGRRLPGHRGHAYGPPRARRDTDPARGDRILLDCGEGTQRQLLRSQIGLVDLDVVLFSHYHADHVLGLPGLLKTYDLRGREQGLELYGPSGSATC